MELVMNLFAVVLSFLLFSSAQASDIVTDQVTVGNSPNVLLSGALNLRVGAVKAKKGNDIWGWTDPSTGKEYAIMGLDSKTSFVDVTDPVNPIHLADMKTATISSTWRDMKIYKNYAFIVSEAWRHGMQVFDLHRLRKLNGKKVEKLKPDFRYRDFGNAHNIFINEETGYGYAVGTSTCDGGLHIMDLRSPLAPKFLNCIGRGVYELPTKHGKAYTHDVQCVVYKGPDARYLGREICISSNEDTVNIVDVTDKNKPVQIGVASYDGVKYTHQGWLTEDHTYFLLGDELDESKLGVNTKTFIWDFSNLENPKNFAVHTHKTKAIDHNMYVKGDYVYQANYSAGLRILSLKEIVKGKLTEVGFLDTLPQRDSAEFEGVWSIFPYFKSGTVALAGIDGVLYLTRPELP
ncbi:MAG: choice-of-anchor B domain-containing protein [Bacteriovoracaceae bacterium]|jgi:choice-of-anchor B domain-containing protein